MNNSKLGSVGKTAGALGAAAAGLGGTQAAVSAIPEPTSLALLAAGASGVAVYRRRRTP